MTVTTVEKDLDALTMTVTAEFDAATDRVWQLYADPRKLEQWWGPPMFPATFVQHDLSIGGVCTYFMTGPEGETHGGWWQVLDVEPARLLKVRDGFGAGPEQAPPDMPTMVMTLRFEDRGDGGTRVRIVTEFGSLEQLQQLLEMGMEEGLQLAMGQMDDVLATIAA